MLFILILLVFSYAIKVFIDTRGITFYSPRLNTDNEKMLALASQLGKEGLLRWPGSIHNLNNGKGRAELREFWIFFMAYVQKMFPKEKRITEHVNITLSIISHSISTLLIYGISNYFLPSYYALLISTLYLFSTWCTEVVLYLGHIIYSQFWFLCSLGFILFAYINQNINTIFLLCIFFAGFLSSICFTSSSASRKFPPILILSQIFICINIFSDTPEQSILKTLLFITALLILAKLFLTKTFKLINKFIISKINNNSLTTERNTFLVFNFLSPVIIFSLIVVFPAFIVNQLTSYLHTQLVFTVGIFSGFFLVLMPNPIKNLKRYMTFLDIGSWASHFLAYPDQKKVFGKTLPRNFRGAGLRWIPPFFWSLMPIELSLFFLTLISMVYCYFTGATSLLSIFLILLIGIMPTLIVEITNGLQVGKSYLSSLTGILITIVLGFRFFEITFKQATPFILTLLAFFQLIRLIRNYKKDLLPCRMGPAWLRQFLLKNNLNNIYTYDTSYNNCFVRTLVYGFESQLKVNFVNKIDECPDGSIFVVPPTSSKSVSMETESEAIINGNFRDDPRLNTLLDNNSIEKYAIAKFKTLGSSKYYVNESEVTSYRYHILNQITDHDRILSCGWVLDLKLLKM